MVCEEPNAQLNVWAVVNGTSSTVNDRPGGDVFKVTQPSAGGTLTNWTPARSAVVLEGTLLQIFPASVVLSTVPPRPTAQPTDELMKETLLRSALTGCCSVQLVPPSVVLRIAPAEPTTQPVSAS